MNCRGLYKPAARPGGTAAYFSFAVSISLAVFSICAAAVFGACSFDYGAAGETDKNKPDIVMDNLEYVRVRGGDPLMRLEANHAERWEDRQTMDLRDFSFEQMQDHGDSVNAEGQAGEAEVQLDSGDISLKGGVTIRVNSEDVTIKTSLLDWKDKDKILSGRENAEVDIKKSDGTSFTGTGFTADARNRTWSFSGAVKGQYVETDKTNGENQNTVKPAGEDAGQIIDEVEKGVETVEPVIAIPDNNQPVAPED